MTVIATALAPIFGLILIGFVIRRKQLLAEEFWIPCERLNYFLFFPCLLFGQIATARLDGVSLAAIAASLLGGVAVGALALYGARALRPQPGPIFSSVLQGALRPNTYVGVAAAATLFGKPGVTAVAVAIAVTIPVLNVASILILSIYGDQGRPPLGRLARTVLTNPVILSVLAGAAANRLHLQPTGAVASLLSTLGSASLPLGLLAVGAGLEWQDWRTVRRPVLESTLVKLAVAPLATYALGRAVGLGGVMLSTAVLFNALPCTPSAYIMARLLGGDHRVSAAIISVQTGLAALSLPLVLLLLS
jgi:malonate transporter